MPERNTYIDGQELSELTSSQAEHRGFKVSA